MTPEVAAAVAAWVAAILAGLFGITGFVVGLIGLHHARQAKEAATSANLIAKDANSISRRANTLSEQSNDIAKEANEISRRVADRADEQHDVAWEWEFNDAPNDDLVTIQNIGKHQAVHVVAQFMFEDITEANDPPVDVDGRATFNLHIAGLREAFAAERAAEAEAHTPTQANLGFLGQVRVPSLPRIPEWYRYRLRVSWRTKAGTPKHYDSGWQSIQLPI